MRISKLHRGYFVFCMLLLSSNVAGQSINSYCKVKADSLIKNGIDTIIYFQPFVGPLTQEANECCMIYERSYLIWKKEQKLFVLKHFDYYHIDKNSKGKNTLILEFQDTFNIFCFLNENFQNVVNDKLLPAKLKYLIDNKEFIDDYSILKVYDDSYTQVSIFANGNIYQNGYMSNDLNDGTIINSDGTFREKRESINFQTNIHKAIYKFITKIEKQVALLH